MSLKNEIRSVTPKQFEDGLNQLGANLDDLFRREAEMKWNSSFWKKTVLGLFADLPKPWQDMVIGSERGNW